MEAPVPIDGSSAGRAFLGDELVEQTEGDLVRGFVPLLDGTDRVGVLAFTSERLDEPRLRWPGSWSLPTTSPETLRLRHQR